MKTHCKYGHEMVPENIVRLKDGSPQCRCCKIKRCAEWRKNNRERHNQLRKNWTSQNPESQANMRLKATFGITLEEYNRRAIAQNNLCMICGEEEVGIRLAVDHDHETEQLRDLLCRKCNSGLGQFRDNINLLHNAAAYLERWKNKG